MGFGEIGGDGVAQHRVGLARRGAARPCLLHALPRAGGPSRAHRCVLDEKGRGPRASELATGRGRVLYSVFCFLYVDHA